MAANERVSVNAEEALRIAGWIKEGKMGEYGNTGSVRFRRESRILLVTFAPDQAGKKELRLERPRPCSSPPRWPRCARTSAKQGNELATTMIRSERKGDLSRGETRVLR